MKSKDLAVENILNTVNTLFTPSTKEAVEKLQNDLDDFMRAFGNCTICYGKGYQTNYHGLRASGDFEGEKDSHEPMRVHMEFCSCERGKQLYQLWYNK